MRMRPAHLLLPLAALTASACTAPSAPRPDPPPPTVAVDADGSTLYRYDRPTTPATARPLLWRLDTAAERRLFDCDPGTPAGRTVVVHRPGVRLSGIDPTLVGFLERADGTRQLAIRGCPVYRYRGDHEPGQTTGDRVDGQWFAIRWS